MNTIIMPIPVQHDVPTCPDCRQELPDYDPEYCKTCHQEISEEENLGFLGWLAVISALAGIIIAFILFIFLILGPFASWFATEDTTLVREFVYTWGEFFDKIKTIW